MSQIYIFPPFPSNQSPYTYSANTTMSRANGWMYRSTDSPKGKTLLDHQEVLEMTLANSDSRCSPISVFIVRPNPSSIIIPLCLPVGWYPANFGTYVIGVSCAS